MNNKNQNQDKPEMEALKDLIERHPHLVNGWHSIHLKERADLPYSYKRKDFPRWFLSTSECKVLFGGCPQRIPDAFCYQPVGHHLVALFDCKKQLKKLLEE